MAATAARVALAATAMPVDQIDLQRGWVGCKNVAAAPYNANAATCD
jgi:hypothetical protein